MPKSTEGRIAVVLSTHVTDKRRAEIARGEAPRHDMLLLVENLGARLIMADKHEWGGSRLARARRMLGTAWRAFRLRRQYDIVIVDLDHVGGILALLFKITRSRKRLIVICHGKLSRGFWARALKMLQLHRNIDHFVCYGRIVADRLRNDVGLSSNKVHWVRHPPDHHFWRPSLEKPEILISSAGALRRDYATLVKAVSNMEVQVHLAAFSPWVNPASVGFKSKLPDNVEFQRLTPKELRTLYDRSAFIVIPVIKTDSQAGSLVVYESMAMGKAVVVAATNGMKALGIVEDGVTGYFYRPGDVDDLKDKIRRLLDNPEEASTMGRRARLIVEDGLNIDAYIATVAGLVRSMAHS